MYSKNKNIWIKLGILFLFFILFLLVRYHLYLRMHYWKGEKLRVAYAKSQLVNATLSPFGPGLEREAVRLFCRNNFLTPVWIPARNKQRALEMLKKDKADLAVGFFSPKKTDKFSFARRGPVYLNTELLVVHNKYRYPFNEPQDFCQAKTVYLDRRFWQEKISSIQKEMQCSINRGDLPKSPSALFSALDHNNARFGLTDNLSLDIWHPFFTAVRKSRIWQKKQGFRWIWARRYSELDKKLSAFSHRFFPSSKFDRLQKKYLGFLPQKLDHYQIYHFLRKLRQKVPRYEKEIRKGAEENGLDPLFLVAQIYQESHFDPGARSRTGVRGLMQISRSTARELGVNRLDPGESIRGGADYMGYLWDQVGKRGVLGWDRWFMALAAYNQGMSHLWDAMQLARQMGKDPKCWQEIKEIYPLLSYKKYYSRVPNGYCRGFEAVDYVQSIRFYYYILRGLVFLGRPEVEHLGRLTGRLPPGWP